MSLPWFRFYHEWAGDAKVQTLSFEHQRHFVMILCWHASGILPTLTDDVIAESFRMTEEELASMKKVFRARGFIEKGWKPKNWEKRQRASDDSKARVQAFRDRKREAKEEPVTVTPPLHHRDVTEFSLISSSPINSGLELETSKSEVNCKEREEEKNPLHHRDVTVTSSEHANGALKPCPDYPDPETSFVIQHTGKHSLTDENARDIWRRLWAKWHDEKLMLGWYQHQRWFAYETWIEAFAGVQKQYPGQRINIGLVESFARDIEAKGSPESERLPPAPSPSSRGRPKSEKQQWRENNAAHIAKLKAKIASSGEEPDVDDTEETP